jgi:outer membrane protein
MKSLNTIFFILLLSPLIAHSAPIKIAYVNAVKVIEDAPQAKRALAKLEAEFRPRDEKIVVTTNKIKELEDKLGKESAVMTASDRRSIEKNLLILKRNLKRESQEFREDYNLRRNEELAALQKLVYRVIVDIAKKGKYDLIVHEATIYASKKIDITNKVLQKLQEK